MTAVLIIVGIVVLLAIFLMVLYNGLVKLRNRIENAWAQIDVQLKRRYDLIPNLVETVKGYASHERETLEAVTQARNMAVSADGPHAQAEAENVLSGALKSLFAVSEAYPDLKANQNFLNLQEELTGTEGRIAYAPVEDLLFGFAMILWSQVFWIYFGRRGVQRKPRSGPPIWERR